MIKLFKVIYILSATGLFTVALLFPLTGWNFWTVFATICFLISLSISRDKWSEAIRIAEAQAEIKFQIARDKAIRKAMKIADDYLNS